MVYINSRGEIVDGNYVSWRNPVALFWEIVNFVVLFFQTLNPLANDSKDKRSRRRVNGVSDFRGGGGPPPPPMSGGG